MPHVALYKGKTFLSRVIQWRTWSEYSHAAWICRDGSVVEAWVPGGVRHVANLNEQHTPGTEVDLFTIVGFDPFTHRRIDELMLAQKGRGYDIWGILGFVVRRRTHDPRRVFCSELVVEACRLNNVELVRKPAWKTSPGDLGESWMLRKVGSVVTE